MDIKTLINQMRTYYKALVSAHCPILNEAVYFSSDGFNHLIFDTNRKPRNINEQYLKLKYLPKAREVIEKCPLVSESCSRSRLRLVLAEEVLSDTTTDSFISHDYHIVNLDVDVPDILNISIASATFCCTRGSNVDINFFTGS